MACAFGTFIYDGRRCKIFTVAEAAASAAANSLTTTFAANGMTDFQGALVPNEIQITKINAVTDENISVAILAAGLTAAGFVFRKLTAGANADLVTWQVTLRVVRGIMA